jgi:hypothetical protein
VIENSNGILFVFLASKQLRFQVNFKRQYLMSIKLKIARAQLGTALSLFIKDKDALSVHALACGGSEVIEGLANQQEVATLTTHILKTFPDVDIKKIYSLRNQYWNAIKHFYDRGNKTARDDEELMTSFSDEANDVALFNGWHDYHLLTKKLPVEVQVFQVWWYAKNENKMNPQVDLNPFRMAFPKIMQVDRAEQKRLLRRAIEKYRNNKAILTHPSTEVGPLVIGH